MKMIFLFLSSLVVLACSEDAVKLNANAAWNQVVEDETPDPLRIELFGEQFKWTIRYAGDDNVLGKFDYKLTSKENPLALVTTESIESKIDQLEKEISSMDSIVLNANVTQDFSDKQHKNDRMLRLLKQMREKHSSEIDILAQDDVIIQDTLFLCVDKEYEFSLRSKDVIHAAYFPHFRTQMNVVPGMTTRFKLTPTETTLKRREKEQDDEFEFMLLCNKICGSGHFSMKTVVRVVEKEKYLSWINRNDKNVFRNQSMM